MSNRKFHPKFNPKFNPSSPVNARINRTDLAYEAASKDELAEGITLERGEIENVKFVNVAITPECAEKGASGGKKAGKYSTLFCGEEEIASQIEAVSKILSEFLPNINKNSRFLIAGLGNENVTPDSLGTKTASKVLATAHFSAFKEFEELQMREVYIAQPGVLAQTGMESAEQLKYISDGLNPDCLIVIDALACRERERLGKTIQITDTGISPGSGVKNERKEFSREVFGVPVIAVGVPTVIDLRSLINASEFSDNSGNSDNNAEASDNREDFMVVPRNIDALTLRFSKVISSGINKALNPKLSEADIENLLI